MTYCFTGKWNGPKNLVPSNNVLLLGK
ncbi:MAG: DUF1131 family protein [Arsenophonus sp. NC-PE1-MAG3]